MIVRAMIASLSNGYLAGNATIAAILLLGVILTGTYRRPISTRVAGVIKSLPASVCVSVCVCVYPHDRTKTAETRITKLATGIVHHESWLPI